MRSTFCNYFRRASRPAALFAAAAIAAAALHAQAVSADMRLAFQVIPPSGISSDGKIRYVASVMNAGPAPAVNVILEDSLPVGVLNVSAEPGSCLFTPPANLRCALGTLAPGTRVAVTIVVHPVTIGSKVNSGRVTASTPDPNLTNNSASATSAITEVNVSDLSVSLAVGPDPIHTGGELTYVASIRNIGDDDAQNVLLTDALPAGVAALGAVPSQGTCTGLGSTLTCRLGVIPSRGAATVRIRVRPSTPGILYNTVSVAPSTVDPNLANNAASSLSWVTDHTLGRPYPRSGD
jgi:uncharacterized repeat protein (TIGR01451 family)